MKELVDKFAKLERKISQQKGDFTLFALFLRDNALNKWDLLVAAPWIESDRKAALTYITKQIQASFTAEEMIQISRIVMIDQTNPTLDIIYKMTKLEHGIAEIKDNDLFGLQIKHAFIITSRNPLIHAEMMN